MFILRDDQKLSRPDIARKVIKARDFWAFKEARHAVDEGLERKEQILRAAEEAFRAERERGWQEGHESARLAQSGSMLQIVAQTAEYYGKLENEMSDLVLEAVRKVVNDFSDQQRVSTVVRNCLDLVRSQKQLRLNVHPSQVDFLRERVDDLRRDYPNITTIEVHPDARLGLDACLVESDIGIVEASLTGQLEVLRETLSSVFAPAPERAAEVEAARSSAPLLP